MKKLIWTSVFIAFGVALIGGARKAKAQISEIQPFTAIETQITRSAKFPVPRVTSLVLAVSGDGQKVARIVNKGNTKQHLIWDKTNQKHVTLDSETKMLINQQYEDIGLSLTAGAICEGTPDAQIEGFDVNRFQHPIGKSPSGGTNTVTTWAAPKLGCYILRKEEVETDMDGKIALSFVHTLSNIKIGEPDPSYFDTSLPEGYTEGKFEDYRGAKVNLRKAQQKAQQPQ
jgi:hypothetical protein